MFIIMMKKVVFLAVSIACVTNFAFAGLGEAGDAIITDGREVASLTKAQYREIELANEVTYKRHKKVFAYAVGGVVLVGGALLCFFNRNAILDRLARSKKPEETKSAGMEKGGPKGPQIPEISQEHINEVLAAVGKIRELGEKLKLDKEHVVGDTTELKKAEAALVEIYKKLGIYFEPEPKEQNKNTEKVPAEPAQAAEAQKESETVPTQPEPNTTKEPAPTQPAQGAGAQKEPEQNKNTGKKKK
jgi:hypothetical protein